MKVQDQVDPKERVVLEVLVKGMKKAYGILVVKGGWRGVMLRPWMVKKRRGNTTERGEEEGLGNQKNIVLHKRRHFQHYSHIRLMCHKVQGLKGYDMQTLHLCQIAFSMQWG